MSGVERECHHEEPGVEVDATNLAATQSPMQSASQKRRAEENDRRTRLEPRIHTCCERCSGFDDFPARPRDRPAPGRSAQACRQAKACVRNWRLASAVESSWCKRTMAKVGGKSTQCCWIPCSRPHRTGEARQRQRLLQRRSAAQRGPLCPARSPEPLGRRAGGRRASARPSAH